MLLAVVAIAEFFLTSGCISVWGYASPCAYQRHYAPTSNVGISRAAHLAFQLSVYSFSGSFWFVCYLIVINELFYLETGEGTIHFNNVLAL